MTPAQRYQADLTRDGFVTDPAQASAMELFERLYHELTAPHRRPRLFDRWLKRKRVQKVQGIYLWGSVGRGKTYLVDTFFDCVPGEQKLRIHFHSFMRKVHAALKENRHTSDPLSAVADDWMTDLRLLCLDEFHIGDITDAMLLGKLLEALFERGLTLVATSNDRPDDLYRNGLQRDRFLPAIEILKAHVEVYELVGANDYRLRALERAKVYHVPHDEQADSALAASFVAIAPEPGRANVMIEVNGRDIPARRSADGVTWFEFESLCGGPRSTYDYIEIALCHHTVLVSAVPRFTLDDNDAARRFINMVDEFYDRNVNLVMSAAATPSELYAGTRLDKLFKRTASRLQEMQSHEYLARPHLCD